MPERISWEQINKTGNSLLSPAYKSNGHVFTSGSVGVDPVTGKIPEDLETQAEIAIANLKHVLEKSGTSIDKVLKVLLFIGHPSYAATVNKVYAKYFINKPARSCVVVSFPNPNVKVEMECIAEYEEIKTKL
ncbi:hypothetical protein PACTADRAFT_51785 [Pachysolen tannophilus NRRL Y-2460]|uniref:Uncharacterized protein n=1 Tax=Pachysolen tannophilus NRRL Y-2460 TaxID=669874 RepID=A0A1E4TN34_PACTA|nr:hypothetical protein PACTADRAFT_51785 [Pachysolen tannophilus NRRL Y-2460]